MKKLLLIFLTTITVGQLSAQTNDTVSLGAMISNQAYYSLLNGEQDNDISTDWDIAFQTESAFGTSILINPANGIELYLYPGDTSDWSNLTAFDTSWTQLYNADTSWDYGAFSQNQTSTHVGWGQYNMTTHEIHGDKIFVIKLSNGVYQKVWIRHLIGGVYTFRHATLNGSMDMHHTLDKADFAGKNFGYFSLEFHTERDKEPLSVDWDLFFGKYTAFVPTAYGVVGVLHSSQTQSNKAYPVADPSTYIDWDENPMNDHINTIGYDWKSYNFGQMKYDIADSTVYFVKTQHGDVWKLVFDYYGGNATGDIGFNKTQVHFSSVEENSNVSLFELYPNPAHDAITIAYEARATIQLEVIDLSGKIVKSELLPQNTLTHTIGISELKQGLYILSLSSNGERISKRFLVQ